MKRAFAHVLVAPIDLPSDEPSNEDYAAILKRFAQEACRRPSPVDSARRSSVALQFSPPAARKQVLERLNSIEKEIPMGLSQTHDCLAWVTEILKQEISLAILRKGLAVLAPLCLHPFVDPAPFIADLLSSSHFTGVLSSHHEVLLVLLKTLSTIIASKSIPVISVEKLAQTALIGLPTPSCRVYALLALSKFDGQGPMSRSNALLMRYSADSDFRVRSLAFRLLREWIQKYMIVSGSKESLDSVSGMDMDMTPLETMSLELYTISIEALTDDSDDVQMEALRNIWFLANMNSKRLADDAFRKICNMVSDASFRVRALACGLLGTLHGVTPKLLLQSLSKSLLKAGVTSTNGKSSWKEDPFEPGAGQQSVEIVSKLSTQSRLIESGANGAFIHGLEDEFKEVRDAALASMCELAHGSKIFALKSTEFFVDMFNDEIDTVRVHALQSVSKIGQLIFLSEDQLLVVLAMLDDATFTVRRSTRKLLTAIRLMDARSLLTAVNMLQSTLTKHFIERDTILPTFAAIGKNHPHIVELLFEELFKIDTRFVMREPRLDTISYVSIAILLLNAAKENANLIEWLPPFIHRHYLYLKRHYPLLVPDVPFLEGYTHGVLYSTVKAQQITDRVLAGASPSLSNWTSSSTTPSCPGFSKGSLLSDYGASASLFGIQNQPSNQQTLKVDSVLSRLDLALNSLPPSQSLDDKALNDFSLLLASLKRDLTSNCEFEFGFQKEFYLGYLDILEAFFSPQILSDISLRQLCDQKLFFLRSMFIGLPTSILRHLDHLSSLWNNTSLLSEPIRKDKFLYPIWDALRTPIIVKHMLKKVKANILFPSSDPSFIREFSGSLPLSLSVVADIMSDALSDMAIIISCDEVNLKMIIPLSGSHFSRHRPLRYSINMNASIPPQKWDHNKLMHLRICLCRIGPNQLELNVSEPILSSIRAKLR